MITNTWNSRSIDRSVYHLKSSRLLITTDKLRITFINVGLLRLFFCILGWPSYSRLFPPLIISYIERVLFAITITQLLGQQHGLVSFSTFRCPENFVNGSKSNCELISLGFNMLNKFCFLIFVLRHTFSLCSGARPFFM